MVLIARRTLFALLVLGLGACIKRTPVATMDAPTPLLLAMVWDPDGPVPPQGFPQPLQDAIRAELAGRNLVPEAPDDGAMLAAFEARRGTGQRVAWLQEQAGGRWAALVEARVAYSGAFDAQYRWSVSAAITVLPPGGPASDGRLETPVFLRFPHEREEAALGAAAEVVRRRVGRLVDEAAPVAP